MIGDVDRRIFSSSDFRSALGSFATGVAVVTTRDPLRGPVGLTVNSFASVSMEPPLVLWSLRRQSPCLQAFLNCPYFGVSILSESQAGICRLFATPGADKFANVEVRAGLGDVPIVAECSAALECRREAVHEGGDHLIFLGRVEALSTTESLRPLVYFRGAFLQERSNPHGENRSAA